MFANLNLQLTTLLTSDDTGLTGSEGLADTGLQDPEGILSFSEFFSLSTEEAQRSLLADREFLSQHSELLSEGGELLPQDGNPLPPAVPLLDSLAPDRITGTAEELPLTPELLEQPVVELSPAVEVPPAVEPPDVELALRLNYSGNEIPAEIPVDVPEESLILPPGLQLTNTSPGLPGAPRIPAEDYRVAPYRESPPVIRVPPGAPVATPVVPLDAAEDFFERAGPQLPVSPLPRDRRTPRTPQIPLAVPAVRTDASQVDGLRSVTELPELVRQVAAIEPQRQPDSFAKALPPGPPVAGVQLGATPGSATGDLNAPRADLPVETISTSVREPAWGQKLAERVVMLAGVQTRTAEIRLTPAELGPLRVQISVDDGQANVAFQAHSAVTREAIEQALPRLREMLAESGLSLGQADVGEQGVAGRESDGDTASDGTSDTQNESPEEHAGNLEGERQETVISNGLVDTFA